MKYVSSNWQSVCSVTPGGNRMFGCWLPGYTTGSKDGSLSGGNTLAQTIRTMKSPRKQNGQAVGSVRTGIPYAADIEESDALPRLSQQNLTEKTSSPREIPLPEEDSFRAFLHSRLPKHKASQALRDKIRSSIANNEI